MGKYAYYDYIDEVVLSCQRGDKGAKDLLVQELFDMVRNLSNKYIKNNKINEYDIDEIINECLFKVVCSVEKYVVGNKLFIAYAQAVIRNCLEGIGRNVGSIAKTHGFETLIIDETFENTLASSEESMEDKLYKKDMYEALNKALKKLNNEELELIDFLFFENQTVANYSRYKEIPYMHAIRLRDKALNKLKEILAREGYTTLDKI